MDSSSNIWHPYTSLGDKSRPIEIDRAEGAWLYAKSGEKILDMVSSWWVNTHGHCHPHIAEAISEQSKQLDHVIFAGFTHEKAHHFVSEFKKWLPIKFEKYFFSDDGSTAVEVAIKASLQYWVNKGVKGKNKIIALEGAYHGDTFGAMSVSERGIFTNAFQSQLFEVEFIPFPKNKSSLKALRDLIQQGDNYAAFIYEPLVQGAAGMRIYDSEILDELIQVAQDANILTIADEVMTGFGRTGKMFASDYMVNKPDLMCFSKGITGGFLPMGLTVFSDRVVQAFSNDDKLKTLYHGHSYTGNPISCAAAVASLELYGMKETWENISRISEFHQTKVKTLKLPPSLLFKCFGTIAVFEFITTEGSQYHHSLRDKMYHYFLKRNILLRPLGNILYLLPPYCVSDEELETVYSTIQDFIYEFSKENR